MPEMAGCAFCQWEIHEKQASEGHGPTLPDMRHKRAGRPVDRSNLTKKISHCGGILGQSGLLTE
jgi:hypothetical protein